jgi:threonine dehydrogenase-like Zn-dependent dehydrogenase
MRTIYVDKNLFRMVAVKALKPLWPGVSTSRLAPVRFVDVSEPMLPGPHWLRVKNLLCGICGTDLSLLQVEVDLNVAPACLPGTQRFYLGHEVVSVVTEIGPGVTRFQVGDRVIMDSRFQGASCLSLEIDPPCQHCRQGNYQLCENTSVGGARGEGGGWGDGYIAHEWEVYPVPDDISDEQAMMIEPLSVGVRAVLRRLPQAGSQVLVVGAGIIGLTVVQAVRALVPSARITVMARYPHQAEAARELGASTIIGPKDDAYQATATLTDAKLYEGMLGNRMLLGGFDIVYDCVGSSRTLADSLRMARAGGAVIMVGVKLSPLKLDLSPVWYQEVDLIGVYAHGTEVWQGQQRHTYDITIELLRAGKLQATSLITHRFRLEQWREAIRVAQDKRTRSIKVVFDYDKMAREK